MNNNIDWIIHLVANGACDECGKEPYIWRIENTHA